MRTVITGGTVVAGPDVLRAAVTLDGGRIRAVGPHPPEDADVRLDATGFVVLPGLINCHTHGVTPGPLFPSGAAALPADDWLGNLDRHLLAGTTTVLNLCGLATMDEVRTADRAHAVKVKGATTHTPAALAAAQAADGEGLTEEHLTTSVEKQLADGAIAIGELGGGQTMGGGGQDLQYLPAAIRRETGVIVTAEQARTLKEAVLGPRLDSTPDEPALKSALAAAGLAGFSTQTAAKLVRESVLPSFHAALDGLREGVEAAAKHGVPALVHSAAASGKPLLELAGERLGAQVIATHSNHPSYTPDEAVETALALRAAGWLLECCTFDLLHRQHTVRTREHWDRMFAETDVDLLATDYGYLGQHDPLLSGVADLVASGHRSLSAAVALASANVADAIPGLAPGTGRLRPGMAADVVIASEDLREVRHVFVDGIQVVRDGRLTLAAHR
ncbi:amidohydrolase family protein [Amycolatopsis orientalis]|uniref:amidohydrolase family protein n=1 Tax=Amycolatopsis orientalis TaxID=31958 RepID=UPI0003A635DB|nr:amidohydrolase family protein [Amycolatopsis orientalis]